MNIRFILNPVSGKKPADVAALKAQILAVFPGAQICLTQGPGHATTLAQEAAQNGVETVVAMGGDGTINETAKGLVDTQCTLGILPRGSGNGFARELGLMGPLPTALNKLKNASVRPCDAGYCVAIYGASQNRLARDVAVLQSGGSNAAFLPAANAAYHPRKQNPNACAA